jgi:hypothetical protein
MNTVQQGFLSGMQIRKNQLLIEGGKMAMWSFALVPNSGLDIMIGGSDEKSSQNTLRRIRYLARHYEKAVGESVESMFYSVDLIDFTGKTRYVIICAINIENPSVIRLPAKLYSWIFPPEMSDVNAESAKCNSQNYTFFRTKNRRDAAMDYLIRPKSQH